MHFVLGQRFMKPTFLTDSNIFSRFLSTNSVKSVNSKGNFKENPQENSKGNNFSVKLQQQQQQQLHEGNSVGDLVQQVKVLGKTSSGISVVEGLGAASKPLSPLVESTVLPAFAHQKYWTSLDSSGVANYRNLNTETTSSPGEGYKNSQTSEEVLISRVPESFKDPELLHSSATTSPSEVAGHRVDQNWEQGPNLLAGGDQQPIHEAAVTSSSTPESCKNLKLSSSPGLVHTGLNVSDEDTNYKDPGILEAESAETTSADSVLQEPKLLAAGSASIVDPAHKNLKFSEVESAAATSASPALQNPQLSAADSALSSSPAYSDLKFSEAESAAPTSADSAFQNPKFLVADSALSSDPAYRNLKFSETESALNSSADSAFENPKLLPRDPALSADPAYSNLKFSEAESAPTSSADSALQNPQLLAADSSSSVDPVYSNLKFSEAESAPTSSGDSVLQEPKLLAADSASSVDPAYSNLKFSEAEPVLNSSADSAFQNPKLLPTDWASIVDAVYSNPKFSEAVSAATSSADSAFENPKLSVADSALSADPAYSNLKFSETEPTATSSADSALQNPQLLAADSASLLDPLYKDLQLSEPDSPHISSADPALNNPELLGADSASSGSHFDRKLSKFLDQVGRPFQNLFKSFGDIMHRWFFADEPEVCQKPIWSDDKPVEKVDVGVGPVEDIWHFSVKVERPLMKNERVAITGDCDSMGNWLPAFTEIMTYDSKIDRYTVDLKIPRDRDVNYRYAIIAVENNPLYGSPCRRTAIRQWETHIVPRAIRQCQTKLVLEEDVFGWRDRDYRVDHGWAITETYLQFKFFNRDLLEAPNFRARPMYIKITPLFTKKKENFCEKLESSSDGSLPSDFYCGDHPSRTYAFVEVVDQAKANDVFEYQHEYGTKCGPDEMILFHLTLGDFEHAAYRFDIYTYGMHVHDDEPPYHYGYTCLGPDDISGSEGSKELMVTCASTFRPRGTLKIEYLLILGTYGLDLDMSRTYCNYWNQKRDGSLIGHRGCGLSYTFDSGIFRENTIYSFDRVFTNGADMLEMDVMLSRDYVPIIYHDFMLNLALKPIENLNDVLNEHDIMVFEHGVITLKSLIERGIQTKKCFMSLPVACFDVEELQKVQVLRYATDKTIPTECMTVARLSLQNPFPPLEDVLQKVPIEAPFVLEIKWPQLEDNGYYEEKFKHFMDKNEFVDSILQLIFKKAGSRKIYLACFDVDICIMLRYKQNFYPVILNYDHEYADIRLKDFTTAAILAKIHGFFGLSVRDSIVFDEPANIGLAITNQLVIFTWGSLSNWEKNRKILLSYGVNALIFDRIDQKRDSTGIPLKKNVFIHTAVQSHVQVKNLLAEEMKKRISKRLTKDACFPVPVVQPCKCPKKK